MSLGSVLLIILILAMIGVLRTRDHSRSFELWAERHWRRDHRPACGPATHEAPLTWK
jgi:hypothetical protein